MGDGHHHVLFIDQFLDHDGMIPLNDLGPSFISISVTDFLRLFTDDTDDPFRCCKNVLIIRNGLTHRFMFVTDFFLFQSG